MRFYGRTSDHARVVHFKTWEPTLTTFFTSGISGVVNVSGLTRKFTPLSGHSATLPMYMFGAGSWGSLGTAMTSLPFYASANGASRYWSMQYTNTTGSSYWSVDDITTTEASTLHQMWVRPALTVVPGESPWSCNKCALDVTFKLTVVPGESPLFLI